jgi:assimilatory nitrate reductase catalytic subunit
MMHVSFADATYRLKRLLRERDGNLTRELLLQPGRFGLGLVPDKRSPDALATSVCGFCSTGCALDIHLRGDEAIGLSPTLEYPVNAGLACPKGWEALSVLQSSDRATTPLLKDDHGNQMPVDWDAALRTFVARMKGIQGEHGPHSIAWLGTGQLVTEELAFLGALAKFGMGMLHGDGNTRQCMATAVTAYKQSFGFDAPPYTYADLEESDVLVFIGANPCIAHPIMWERVMRNRKSPQIIVVDPRRTETAMQATLHLAVQPKSDLALCYGLANLLIGGGWIDQDFIDAHTTGFADFAAFVKSFSPDRVSELTGVATEVLERVARTIGEAERVSFWWTMGVNQSYEGTRVAQSIINLALLTGNIGRPGTGANSITGQCNAMGSRLFSNTTNLLGGRDFANADHRGEVADALGISPDCIPAQNSQAYHEILESILAGKIRGLWVVATNPAHSWINNNHLRDVLGRLDFLVVQDMYSTTETARLADLLLPAAAWGEKEGTFINSERRIGVVKKVAKAPGQALADFAIFRSIAEYWGCGEKFRQWTSPAAVFQLLKRLSAGRPCDITGIADYQMLEDCGGIQWPFAAGDHGARGSEQQRRLFADGRFYHADGRARFIFDAPRPIPEPATKRFPFVLLTGRGTSSQWHTETRTRKSAVLRKLSPEQLYVEINTSDAREMRIRPGESVIVESQRGEVTARAFVTPTVARGQVFLPMHYDGVNRLTDSIFDPYSKQPSYKACAVRLRPMALSSAAGQWQS